MSARPDFIQEAIERFDHASNVESSWRADCLDDLQFSTGNQWPLNIRTQRDKDGKPCLTMDQTTQSIRLICNEFRQQRPAVEINPVGDEADVDTAEILQGIVRHIEVNSDAEIAYDTAHEQVVRTGIGHWRILSEYAADDTDEQEIILEPIRNQFSVYWQPEFDDYSKKTWAFIVKDLPVKEYKRQYPDSELAKQSLDSFAGIGNPAPNWVTKDTYRVAEYFTVEEVDGKSGRKKKKVTWRLINAIEELEKRELPGNSIPILTVVGDDIDVDGKRYIAGVLRPAKDPQRMTNYWYTKATESIALASTPPWIMAEGQDEGFENDWAEANSGKTQSVLHYKLLDVLGKPAPPPERNSMEPPIQAVAQMMQQSIMNVKASMGIYDPSLGQRKGDESGTAIKHLQEQGSVTTINFSDNASRTMRRGGRLLLEWIRDKYDTPRVRRIIKPDGSVQMVVTHNGPDQAEAAEKLLTEKIQKIYDIGVGRYDVTISVGPSYQTKRQEAVSTQLELIKASPELFPIMGDILVANMDIPGAREISDRLKKMLPPQLQDQQGTPEGQLAEAHAALQQLTAQNQQLTQHVNQMSEVIKTKQVETQGKVQIAQFQEMSKQSIVKMQEATKIAVAQINASKDANQTIAEGEIESYHLLHESAHETALDHAARQHEAQQADMQRQHEQDLADKGALNDQQQQQSDQGHDLAMAAVQSDNGDGE